MRARRPSPRFLLLLLACALLILLPPAPAPARHAPAALAPVEVLATRFHDLQGLAWGPDGALYAADRQAGVVYRVLPAPGGGATVTVHQAGLRQPAGLAWGPDGALYVVETKAGRVLRLGSAPAPVWEDLLLPAWLAWGPDGSLYLTALGQKGRLPALLRDVTDAVEILRRHPDGSVTELVDRLLRPGGLWVEPSGAVLATVERQLRLGERQSPSLLRFDPAGGPGQPAAPLVGPGLRAPVGPVADGLGAILLGARQVHAWGPLGAEGARAKPGLLLKAPPGQAPTLLGAGFDEVRALALDPAGNLYVAADDTLYRLRAPAAPRLEAVPPYTNQPALTLSGAAEAGARITVLGAAEPAQATAHRETGAFTLTVPLVPNAENRLAVYATGAGGAGLTSAAAEAALTHDDLAPETAILTGPPAEIGLPEAAFTFAGSDNLTPGEALQYAWRLDGGPWSAFSGLPTARLTDLAAGPHLFEVRARDLAGNFDPTPAAWRFAVSLLRVTITQPTDGAALPAGPLLVRGTVESGGQEVGVTVSGYPAAVQGKQWAVVVPIREETVGLTAAAAIQGGPSAIHQIAIQVDPTSSTGISLEAIPPGGMAPLTVRFEVRGSPERPITSYAFDREGDGTPEWTGTVLGELRFTYEAAGIFRPTLTMIDDQGRMHQAVALVQALDKTEIIGTLRGKWDTLSSALAAGDLSRALLEIAVGARERYRAMWQALGPNLPTIIPTMGAVSITRVTARMAEGVVQRTHGGRTYLHFIYWAPDVDGIWRIIGM